MAPDSYGGHWRLPTGLGVSGWQVYSNTNFYANPAGATFHGDPAQFAAAPAIPAQNRAEWVDCGPSAPLRSSPYAAPASLCPSALTIGMRVGSILSDCHIVVNWNWSDAGSDIDSTNCTQSSSPTGQGLLTLTSTCQDLAGNKASSSYSLKVDTTLPIVAFAGNAGTYTVDQSVLISCSASDALTGITNSLCVKLNAAAAAAARGQSQTQANILSAFNNEVAAQSGKSLTAIQAAILTEFVKAL